MQPVGGGAPRPGRGVGFPGSRRQLDSAALLMLLVDADRPEPVRSGARELALFLTPEPGAEAAEVEETVEGLLLRLEEFCSLADMIRSDTSQILEENIPLLKAKVMEMRGIYAKVDQLEKLWTPAAPTFELPALYRTEDYFPVDAGEATRRAPSCQRRL
ncbi:breast carcinoma-amplified sequence 4 isoform X8 [Orcinus orca]|uniref:Breast carcinoma-amplified sequence 4 isoform X4 n=1 Tax=Tursiops truncatus TaxID=9739 RepID=A0A2U4C2E0_TURTR|nr:breast carcinoma-amplified sequence 4 isoform X8 [Orcinus orca]XP_019799584.1 breast carcinoma-amplified sequence 4 isoform X4 [Tursiops truncatus]XP_059978780.1 breast carcinoma-amplified sequence 4 isoform X6 [Lagenorhynchus albirostris]